MSTGRIWMESTLRPVADAFVGLLRPGCERIEVAGSLRRSHPQPHDIEIVCIPKLRRDLFGEPTGEDELDPLISRLLASGELRWRPPQHEIGKGKRYYKLADHRTGVPIDLFAVRPPAQWGAIMAIRTGPADYSRRLVTGCQRLGLRCVNGALVHQGSGKVIDTPEEEDFIAACGEMYLPPSRRF